MTKRLGWGLVAYALLLVCPGASRFSPIQDAAGQTPPNGETPPSIVECLDDMISTVQSLVTSGDIASNLQNPLLEKLQSAKASAQANQLKEAAKHLSGFNDFVGTHHLGVHHISTAKISHAAFEALDSLYIVCLELILVQDDDKSAWCSVVECEFTLPNMAGDEISITYNWTVKWVDLTIAVKGRVDASVRWFAGDVELKPDPNKPAIVQAQPVTFTANEETSMATRANRSFSFKKDNFKSPERGEIPLPTKAIIKVVFSGEDGDKFTWGKEKNDTCENDCHRLP